MRAKIKPVQGASKQVAGVERKKRLVQSAKQKMQVTSAKYDKIYNLCKAQENRALVPNVLMRENIETVQISCKQVTWAKRGKSLANTKSGKTFNLCQAW